MLHLYQEITLLALRDEKGTVSIDHLAQVLAGALVAELVLEKKIVVSNDKKKWVDLVEPKPTGDPLLDECIEKLAKAKRRARLQTWVERFSSIKKFHHKAAQSLCDLGILERKTGKFLLVFNRRIYPENNPQPERQIIERLETAIFAPAKELSGRDALLVSLAHASKLLDQVFGHKRIKLQRARIQQIIEGEAVGKATQELIAAIQLTIITAAVVSAVVAGS
ncbi:GPP34 family phosphoprotein [Pelagicoccus sp. SDUM812002]|uniref:GOLPH3/VPS74 family protein n=1 Tax=Pelagicoccus sp. SDUM812002 TaxID=3041266 RepID=UPI00280E99CA|nr:GPP34 family phosphoprotein [Pelagicoccus sp. SDUM812002]MDQ8185686.1 GPP34 family phosphoprotein [Pelagicoccus sp. SDUM812002]